MILIALGSNLAGKYSSSEEVIEHAKSALEKRNIAVEQSSKIFITEPVPISDQPWYRNAVVLVSTDLSLLQLFSALKEIEKEFGRESAERNAARILDLDLIAYNDEIYEDDNLTVPHPRMHERAFVLYPFQQVAPEWIHPVLKKNIDDLIKDLPAGQGIKLSDREAA